MTKREQRIGRAGENQAASKLAGLGIEMVEKIGTPVELIPAKTEGGFRRKDIFYVVFGQKVSGDHRGILPGGRSVLIETKTILDRNLQWSDLREHQPGRLINHAELGGLSLLTWVHNTGIYVMEFQEMVRNGFGPRTSVRVEQARRYQEDFIEWLDGALAESK
jgi:hypothetical protein